MFVKLVPNQAWIHTQVCSSCCRLWKRPRQWVRFFGYSYRVHFLYKLRRCSIDGNIPRKNMLSTSAASNQSERLWNQQGTIPYQIPPKEMVQLVDMQLDHTVSFPPGYPKEYMLVIDSPSLPSIEELSRPELRLAGYRIHPSTFTPSRMSFVSNIQIWQLSNSQPKCIMDISQSLKAFLLHSKNKEACHSTYSLEEEKEYSLKLCDIHWAPDGRKFTFCVFKPQFGLQLWLCDIEERQVYPLLLERNQKLHAICESPVKWFHDSQRLLIHLVSNKTSLKNSPSIPQGPFIQHHEEQREAPARTFQDVLKNSYDEACLEYYCTSELAIYDILDKSCKSLPLEPSCFTGTSISPDDKYILIEEMTRPYSYLFPASRFPRKIEIFHIQDASTTIVAELGLQEHIPIDMDAVPDCPRNFQWRANVDATLCWVQALDQGNPKNQVEYRDALYCISAPFNDHPILLFKLKWRLEDIDWSDNEYTLVWEEWYQSRSRRVYSCHIPLNIERKTCTTLLSHHTIVERHSFCINQPSMVSDLECLWDIPNWKDRYHLPGYPMSRMKTFGKWTLRTIDFLKNDKSPFVYLIGPGASDKGDRPYLDILDTQTKRRWRLWQSSPPYYERCIGVYSEDDQQQITQLLISRESPKQLPNVYVVDLPSFYEIQQKQTYEENGHLVDTWNNIVSNKPSHDSCIKPLTFFEHPFPGFLEIQRELVEYDRQDGVKLHANLYLPPHYDPKKSGPLPTFIWAYPQEYLSSDTASQLRDSPFRFVHLARSPLYWLTQGYAILDGPEMPIIAKEGDGHPNDHFISQLVSSAQAAVDFLVERGVSDRHRIAIGGHSYGAFMTANLLAHAPKLFCCGIARSGAYNRTLTPFGFQMEDRNLWQIPSNYIEMSPFMYADRISSPLLLIHGELDNNDGTHLLQSERMFSALKGLGKVVRFLKLPLEAHHYRSRESVLHVLYEMHQWLETFCR
ncbi:serine-type peptidase [Galdieria sulphuraria]|uniref:Serine-type peptidase n=1 Tax=Galdieria sulphuraria TaxID=130081 RepID=M2W341_GALSU|nr:serine-type peptidase [Galdieria sulphuraria]EME30116.1 serine-type peptidase [Galdieria sulphuraria]|eukprot:XP_005706636.1 serine-type peptidase [Galdieria sulphuraria]